MRPLFVAFTVGLLACPATAETPLFEATLGLELFPCELSALSCTTLTLPLDHRANDPSKTIEITFALSFASDESRGILFYFVGGPGASGLASAESYLATLDESLLQYLDVVFVDQRGTGAAHRLVCPVAQTAFDLVSVSLDDPEGAKAVAQAYVADCMAELGQDELLPFVNSDQAIRDSEAFRQAIGAPKVWMYGESYGTQFVQAYATQFPQAVRGVILDGVVDLNLDAEGFYHRYVTASEAILADTLAACAVLAGCAADMGGDAALAYDALASRLAVAPVPVALTLADGTTKTRNLTLGVLEANAFYALYSPDARSGFLRVLAAANRGNLGPMLQLGYGNMFIDPETESGLEDPGWSSAAYYAITCTDYDSGSGTVEDRADAIMAEARALAPEAPRLLRSYFMERLACAYWPYQGPATRPAPFAGGDWPTLVLNADADPITPISMAHSVLDSARNAYGVFMAGGPHVIWSRGLACPDGIVSDLLINGTLPYTREQQCRQELVGDYTPLTLTSPNQMADPVAVAQAVDTELYQMIALGNWSGGDPLAVGCDFGGTMKATATDIGTEYRFGDCRFWPNLAISGSGFEINSGENDDSITLALVVSGDQTGDLVYRYRLRDEAWSMSGTWNGRPAVLPRGAN